MIQLDVNDYCQDCPAFVPMAEKFSDFAQNTVITTVCCESQKKCARLVQYLERKVKKDANTGDPCGGWDH